MTVPTVSESDAENTWNKIKTFADGLQQRTGQVQGFSVHQGSGFALDDQRSAPHHVSHIATMTITAAADSLHALCTLLGTGVMHVATPATLTRAVLEAAGTGVWLMSPANSDERISRALRWTVQDIKDSNTAAKRINTPTPTTLGARLNKVKHVTRACGLQWTDVEGGYSSTGAMKAAQEHLRYPIDLLFAWQACSGFAHGRRWAYLGFSENAPVPTEDPDVMRAKLEASPDMVLAFAMAAAAATNEAVRLFDHLAEPAS